MSELLHSVRVFLSELFHSLRVFCQSCSDIVATQHKALLRKIKDRVSLFSEKLPVPKDLVLLEESDEEPETDSSGETEFELNRESLSSSENTEDEEDITVEERLERIIGKTMKKLDFDFQISSASKDLNERYVSG